MLNAIKISLILAQNNTEKTVTTIGIAMFAAFMFFLIVDSIVKQKLVPKDSAVRGFLIFLFIIAIIAYFVYTIFIK